MPPHYRHFEPICIGCPLEAADVLLLVLLMVLLIASVHRRWADHGHRPGAPPH